MVMRRQLRFWCVLSVLVHLYMFHNPSTSYFVKLNTQVLSIKKMHTLDILQVE